MLKQKKGTLFNIFCWDKTFSSFAVSGAPSTGIFELMGSSQLGVSEGSSVTTFPIICYTEKQEGPQRRKERFESFILWKQ